MRKLVVVLISKLRALNDRIGQEQNRCLFAHFRAVEGVQVSEEQAEPSFLFCVCVCVSSFFRASRCSRGGKGRASIRTKLSSRLRTKKVVVS